uniref:rho GTPase-activating protein 6-like isoform X2 n=1 Tax=Doryrhamphus excisus TaxID=161450 RepID=UPI0025ADA694|nr:rho GTPase-activating protein 6-like isoform X2 [Doryrhamphus excisus]XP_057938240.1 rho GTPase-activating protein 6-like isoform X2 [Doryrhamphus excisus]XP_057938241.1 rho GTPase-activating protein 6-like isoform X2 [Doryrhamphus excisus]
MELHHQLRTTERPKTISKRGLRQTRSLDPVLMRHYGVENTSYQGGFTWNSVSGRSVGLKPVPLQSLSELERVRLQDVAFRRLLRDRNLGCHITIPKYGHKHKKSLRRKLDSLSKEKSKDKEAPHQVFSIPLAQVISNDRIHKQRHDAPPEQHSDPTELVLSFLHFTSTFKRANKELSSSNSSLSSNSESPNKSFVPACDAAPRTRRRGGVSVDCITDLDDNQSQLLEALQLSLPVDNAVSSRKKRHDKKLSLNPMYPQVPRIVELCCQHLESHGLQTVGIFRVGSSKKRLRQLREELDQGWELHLDEQHSVHDVAALLKEFLRDMPDPLLTRELYTAFINTTLLDQVEQEKAIQLLVFLLPPCNCDTLQRLLCLLSSVAAHADDMLDESGDKKPGNKMTPLNLATILGPNLLHKQKNPDKEFAVQSLARAEESSAIISVVQTMINACESLFSVPAELQNEVLLSLLETDPDVVDYLLRRKDTRYCIPGPVGPRESSLMERCSSNESMSSGEASPYENNSPVLSERPRPEDDGMLSNGSITSTYELTSDSASRSTAPNFTIEEASEDDQFWDTWHQLFFSENVFDLNGGLGDTSEWKLFGSSEGLNSRQGNNKLPIRMTTQISLDALERRPHPSVPRSRSGGDSPGDQMEPRQPEPSLHQVHINQSGAVSSDNLADRTGHPVDMSLKDEEDCLFGPVRKIHASHSAPSFITHHTEAQTPKRTPKNGPEQAKSQTDRRHIWRILANNNGDALPETLV